MSMFDIVFQPNRSLKEVIDAIIGNVGRYRDSWIEKGDDGNPRLAVYTRNGGGNRLHYGEMNEGNCDCTGCIITYRLPKHELYLSDEDDDFDHTYCTVYFRIPKELEEQLNKHDNDWKTKVMDKRNMSDQWLKMLGDM